MKNTGNAVVKYLVTIGAAAFASLLILWLRDYWSAQTLVAQYRILADAFTIPGVILMCFSGLMWVSSDGFFDSIGYAFSRVGNMFIPFMKNKHETFYDYKLRKGDKRKGGSFWFLFFVGLGFVLVSLIFVILHGTVYVPKV